MISNEYVEAKSSDKNSNLQLKGYASVFNVVDYHGDVIIKGAFASSILRHFSGHTIKFLWQHKHVSPIGIIDNLKEDNVGLYVECSINAGVLKGYEIISLVKQGAIDSFSIGFNVKDSRLNKNGCREILDIDLWEISVVTFPANCYARINTQNQTNHLNQHNLNVVSQRLNSISKTIFYL